MQSILMNPTFQKLPSFYKCIEKKINNAIGTIDKIKFLVELYK